MSVSECRFRTHKVCVGFCLEMVWFVANLYIFASHYQWSLDQEYWEISFDGIQVQLEF